MPVQVIIGDPQRQGSTIQHGDGTGIDIRDGHLVVVSGVDTVAIYAPSRWLRAEVTK
jgi:hypothetical protein